MDTAAGPGRLSQPSCFTNSDARLTGRCLCLECSSQRHSSSKKVTFIRNPLRIYLKVAAMAVTVQVLASLALSGSGGSPESSSRCPPQTAPLLSASPSAPLPSQSPPVPDITSAHMHAWKQAHMYVCMLLAISPARAEERTFAKKSGLCCHG